MRCGYVCRDCGEAVWLAQGPAHVKWLRDREHVVREVADHSSSGVDLWMAEGLQFFDAHRGHDVVMLSERA